MSNTPPEGHAELDNKNVFEKALADFYVVHLAVVYHPEVVLPTYLMTPKWKDSEDVIHLEYGLDMPVPITDMVVTNEGIAATLSFSRESFATFVPWAAVRGFGCDGERPSVPKSRLKLGLVK